MLDNCYICIVCYDLHVYLNRKRQATKKMCNVSRIKNCLYERTMVNNLLLDIVFMMPEPIKGKQEQCTIAIKTLLSNVNSIYSC